MNIFGCSARGLLLLFKLVLLRVRVGCCITNGTVGVSLLLLHVLLVILGNVVPFPFDCCCCYEAAGSRDGDDGEEYSTPTFQRAKINNNNAGYYELIYSLIVCNLSCIRTSIRVMD